MFYALAASILLNGLYATAGALASVKTYSARGNAFVLARRTAVAEGSAAAAVRRHV